MTDIDRVRENQWISIKERMPEIWTKVLVGDVRDGFVGIWVFNGECWMVQDYVSAKLEEVTHWMPLPKPPKGE